MLFSLLSVALPGRPEEPAGVLLYDPASESMGVKLRRDWHHLAEPEDAEILAGIESHLKQLSREMGAARCLAFLEDTLSNTLRLGERNEVSSSQLDFTLHQLYREYVPVTVEPYVTHLPRYALRSAAGAFGEQIADPNEVQDWVEAPEGLRLNKGMFVCEVYGRSMQPLVPSGSLCVFRKFTAGSRNGKRVLVEDRSESTSGGERYTLKVYQSNKSVSAEGDWTHESIELHPLNPDFPVLHLSADEDRYAVLAEFVCVL
ncbi:S24 family peptidase [Bryobacter aggregatus]|uniref:S24 family peptidase n=1 Tax=Bryobacter aggregatus TaxID=360054 RepID=UPI0004E1735C|nr:S24 family peptidase [Bryobacter aggregatus]